MAAAAASIAPPPAPPALDAEADHVPLLLSALSTLDIARLGAVSKSWQVRTDRYFTDPALRQGVGGGAFPSRESTKAKLAAALTDKAAVLAHVRWKAVPASLVAGAPAGPTEGATAGCFAAGDIAVRCGGWSSPAPRMANAAGVNGVHNGLQCLDFNRPTGAVEAALKRLARLYAAAARPFLPNDALDTAAAWTRHNLHGVTEVELTEEVRVERLGRRWARAAETRSAPHRLAWPAPPRLASCAALTRAGRGPAPRLLPRSYGLCTVPSRRDPVAARLPD